MEVKTVEFRKLRQGSSDETCGQTCLAMILGRTCQQICEFMKNFGGTDRDELRQAAINLGIPVIGPWTGFDIDNPLTYTYPGNPLPPDCIVRYERPNAGHSHIIIRHDNMFYCPDTHKEFYDIPPYITHYLKYETRTIKYRIPENELRGKKYYQKGSIIYGYKGVIDITFQTKEKMFV